MKLPQKITFGIVIVLASLLGIRYLNWDKVNWGKIQFTPAETLTVIGEAKGQQKSQVAKFTASVSKTNDDKQTAIDEVNSAMSQIMEKVKAFGVSDEDLKTQTISISQQEEYYYEGDRRKTRPGQWRVSNSVEITLRNVDKAQELTNLLGESGATNVWGPNFYADETTTLESDLLSEALNDAKDKAEKLAKASNKRLGQILTINEGGTSSSRGIVAYDMGGGGGSIEPGTTNVEKTVTVVFELK